ncbi:MAG: acyl-CoA thioesterase [Beijerinckiaceae bacterium]
MNNTAQAKTGAILTEVTLRYSDMDALGHLNNAVYATLYEAGRVAYVTDILNDVTPADTGYVIVKLTIEFKAEAHFPGVAAVSTRISHIGGSSMTFDQSISIGGKLVSTAESICALFDLKRRKATRCPDDLREKVAGLNAAIQG